MPRRVACFVTVSRPSMWSRASPPRRCALTFSTFPSATSGRVRFSVGFGILVHRGLFADLPCPCNTATLERFQALEKIDDQTLIIHNLHKRVWPTAQRDSVILSHLRQHEDTWFVQNYSIAHDAAPVNPNGSVVRVQCNMFMMCKTQIREGAQEPYSRDDLSCKITYLAFINPGGWAPASAIRAVSKREYPKFLRTITKHSTKFYQSKDISF
eukprot:m.49660 g.49660  ORF g.49660 m.49660 type:complete len:212 (-) comp6489_c0_seq2:348-983(-)